MGVYLSKKVYVYTYIKSNEFPVKSDHNFKGKTILDLELRPGGVSTFCFHLGQIRNLFLPRPFRPKINILPRPFRPIFFFLPSPFR